ncbi:MAG: hypothetical protein JXK07_10025 [Spirochaetes bacterium]|nr:hypothetical protein [Spirochaetota bacterium]MBN2771265.1 hypothetical protein [Spirochaetota bacterium]
MHIDKIDLSRSMYDDAKAAGVTFSEHLQQYAQKKEKLSAEALTNGLDAFAQQLAVRGLRLSGSQAALVEDFYRTNDNKVLFPEVINKAVRAGMDDNSLLAGTKDLIATRTGIDGSVYQSAAVDIANSTAKLARVAESAEFPVVTIKFKDKPIKLHKTGYQIQQSYETARRMSINYFITVMKQLGRNIETEKVALLVNTLINGDGNSNPISNVASENTVLKYRDVIQLKYAAKKFSLSFMISDETQAIEYECLPEFTSKNGPNMPPAPKVAPAVPAKKIIALDQKAAIEEIFEKGGSLIEYDKVIEKQLENAVISEVVGYSIMFRDASKMLMLAS